jgi:hypothetical protein
MIRKLLVTTLLLAGALMVGAAAQPPAPQGPGHTIENMPTKTPLHSKLNFLIGNWNIRGETTKDCPWGQAKFTATTHVEQMPGGFILMSRTRYRGAFANSTQVEFFGVDPETSKFTYYAFNSTGITLAAPAGEYKEVDARTLKGNTFTWAAVKNIKGFNTPQAPGGTYTMTVESPRAYSFRIAGPGGVGWMVGTANKVSNPATGGH